MEFHKDQLQTPLLIDPGKGVELRQQTTDFDSVLIQSDDPIHDFSLFKPPGTTCIVTLLKLA